MQKSRRAEEQESRRAGKQDSTRRTRHWRRWNPVLAAGCQRTAASSNRSSADSHCTVMCNTTANRSAVGPAQQTLVCREKSYPSQPSELAVYQCPQDVIYCVKRTHLLIHPGPSPLSSHPTPLPVPERSCKGKQTPTRMGAFSILRRGTRQNQIAIPFSPIRRRVRVLLTFMAGPFAPSSP